MAASAQPAPSALYRITPPVPIAMKREPAHSTLLSRASVGLASTLQSIPSPLRTTAPSTPTATKRPPP